MDCALELSCLAVDALFLGIFLKIYREKYKNLEALKNASEVKIDKRLKKILESKAIPYAVVRGTVYASFKPIPSQFVPGVAGVIQESAVVEHKIQWNPFSRFWSVAQQEIQSFKNSVPFHISNNAIWNNVKIEVMDPLTASEVNLLTIYDKFTPKTDTFGEFVWSWFRGERSKGFQVTEQMLMEGTTLTGIGELYLEGNTIKLRSPLKLTYYLTNMTKEGLIKKLEKESHIFRALSICFGILGAYLFMGTVRTWFNNRRKKRNAARYEEERRQRRRMARNNDDLHSPVATPVCVVCLSNPVEVLIIDCGHLCLCVDCCDQVRSCPICRGSIASTVGAFLP